MEQLLDKKEVQWTLRFNNIKKHPSKRGVLSTNQPNYEKSELLIDDSTSLGKLQPSSIVFYQIGLVSEDEGVFKTIDQNNTVGLNPTSKYFL